MIHGWTTKQETRLGELLLSSRIARLGELVAVPVVALVVILAGLPFVGDDPIAFQAVVWVANIAGIPEPADMSGYDYMRGNLPRLIMALVAAWISASFGEEVIYRAFLITRVAELGSGGKGAWRWVVVVSSVAFGLVHFAWGPSGMVQTAFMGLVLGIAYLKVERNLWVMILAHVYMDTILMVQMCGGLG